MIGKYADGWFTYIPGASEDSPERFAEDVATVREHAERAGRDPDSIKISVTMITVLDEDEANLAELRGHPFVLWNTMLATPTSATYTRWGLTHPYGENWMFSRDCSSRRGSHARRPSTYAQESRVRRSTRCSSSGPRHRCWSVFSPTWISM